ncbi:MAG TPA: DinB family protein [Cyclobacteriaceae bacterium]|nr:DinB family protein [Cyclobacteriaceae bacterium]
MQKKIERIQNARAYILKLIEDLDAEQLNKIPVGLNNNIIWNLGHLIASQQSICYRRAGIEMFVEEKYLTAYKPGTKPDAFVTHAEIECMKKLFLTAIEKFEKDYGDGLFSTYPAWTTLYGIEISTIEDALHFVLFHEGLHTGYIMALKRLTTTPLPS